MNPDAQTLWRAPRWALAALLASLGMLGPFSIDTYLPAFTGIAQSMVLDLVPERRGMASSMQAFVGSAANGFVAGAFAPLVMHSAQLLAATSLGMLCVGMLAWVWVGPRVA